MGLIPRQFQPTVSGLIPAAGIAKRMGCNKMALSLGDKTVIERCLEPMAEVCSQVVVVGGSRYQELAQLLAPYPQVELVYNETYQEAMLTSIRRGIPYLKGDRVFITPGDCPLIPVKVYQQMLSVGDAIVVPVYRGRPGHPVLIDRVMLVELEYGRFQSLKEFIDVKRYTRLELWEPGILKDLDTRDDYQKILIELERE